ncbi:unnamed protein product [Rotaria sp. Silwood1]|nr:unnamed protein product [Rotaria sp. Silwood1]CAF0904555.1 unnamed protein product [Rotaria sp. Silwood1]CAF3371733.1 unnamed protein product [Rotaria sp. Silwood1]CAF3391086.1 unnamed protein product [Rotaria sp. Silwood1]CAF4724555.1 unnamed protein product [Rotaria sp. Silwood1]
MVYSRSVSCSCHLDSTGMTMICDNVHSLIAYQQCIHEQLSLQSDIKLRRGGVITNLTIRQHRLNSLSNGFLQFSYGNIYYQLNDLRYLYIVQGKLRQIDNRALVLIQQTLEYLDLSNNEFETMPKISNNNEEYSNLEKLILSHNQIQHLTISDIRAYNHLEELDLSFNRLQYIDMTIVNYLKNLKNLFLNSNMLRTLTNNIKFPNYFRFKLNLNPLECDCRLRWLRNALNRVEYPIYHDEPQCEMPKALADKKIITLSDEQFVCGPIISKPDIRTLVATTGELATLRCDVYSDPAPEIWWTFQNKIIGKMISTVNEPDIHTGSYTIRYLCLSTSSMDLSSTTCLNKTTTLTISNIGTEHNGTYNCVAAIRNQGRSDNEYLSYELRVRQTSLMNSSFLLWTIGIFLFLFLFLLILLCLCCILRCYQSNRQQTKRNKALLFDSMNNQNGFLVENGNMYKEKNDKQHQYITNGIYDPYDIADSRSQLGPPMYSEVRIVDSTPLRSIGDGSMSSTLLRRNDPFYDSCRSDKQLYEQVYRPSPLESTIVDEFEDEMIFPTGYEEDYQYREDIIKPNQAVDPRRQTKIQHTNHDRTNDKSVLSSSNPINENNLSHQKLTSTSNKTNIPNFDSNHKFNKSESPYAGLVESQL